MISICVCDNLLVIKGVQRQRGKFIENSRDHEYYWPTNIFVIQTVKKLLSCFFYDTITCCRQLTSYSWSQSIKTSDVMDYPQRVNRKENNICEVKIQF